jgi:hypothetical protein
MERGNVDTVMVAGEVAKWKGQMMDFDIERLRSEFAKGAEDMPRLIQQNFDFAVSNGVKIEHSIICPIITVRPQNDLALVPVYTTNLSTRHRGLMGQSAVQSGRRANLQRLSGRFKLTGQKH